MEWTSRIPTIVEDYFEVILLSFSFVNELESKISALLAVCLARHAARHAAMTERLKEVLGVPS